MQSFLSASLTSQTWYMNEFTCVWLICLCRYTHICIIQHGTVQGLLWWQGSPCRHWALSLQPQSNHVIFIHMFFSSISANPLLPHYSSFSPWIWKHHVWFLLFPLALNPKYSIASAVLNNSEIQRMKLKKMQVVVKICCLSVGTILISAVIPQHWHHSGRQRKERFLSSLTPKFTPIFD